MDTNTYGVEIYFYVKGYSNTTKNIIIFREIKIMANSKLEVSALDFDDIKQNLKAFMSQQSQFLIITLRVQVWQF